MAATRLIALHVNKGKTVAQCLADRTDYSQNAAKTNDGEFISSYECDPKTADEEFLLSKRQHQHTFDYMTLLRGQHQGRTEECAHTRCPAQGKIMPKSIAGKNPISRLFNVLLPPLNKFILKMPRKLRPKRITINPEIKFTAPLYSRRKLPMVPAKVPIATKITVNH